jgi:hypothetical protein
MMEYNFDIGYIGGVILNLIIFILLLVILAYIYKLETIGCYCAEHKYRDFIKSYTIISLVFLLFTSFISLKNINEIFGETIFVLMSVVTTVFYFIFVIYIYLTFEYVRYIINEKCKCSEGISRDIIMMGTTIELILFIIAFFTGILIPVFTEAISSILHKMKGFKKDVEEVISHPVSSIKKTPKKLMKSTKKIGDFLKKSVKDLKRLSK